MDISRRSFFSGTWLKESLSLFETNSDDKKEIEPCPEDNYFQSIETCYAFLSEVPLEDLQNEALKRGIAFEGLSKFELAKILFSNGQYRGQMKA